MEKNKEEIVDDFKKLVDGLSPAEKNLIRAVVVGDDLAPFLQELELEKDVAKFYGDGDEEFPEPYGPVRPCQYGDDCPVCEDEG